MIRLNHLALVVSSYARSRDWYTRNLGLEVEFEIPERNTVALQDDSAKHRELAARGVEF